MPSEKLSKALVLYVYQPGSNYTCKECAYFREGKCSQYIPAEADVKPYGSCNLWDSDKNGPAVGTHLRTKEATGYMENAVGFGCKRCEYFVSSTKRCKKVDEEGGPTPGRIDPDACCSRWEKSPAWGNTEKVPVR